MKLDKQRLYEAEKEFWLKLMSHVMQLNQISVINSKEKGM